MSEQPAQVLRPFSDVAWALESGAPDSPLARDVAADLREAIDEARRRLLALADRWDEMGEYPWEQCADDLRAATGAP